MPRAKAIELRFVSRQAAKLAKNYFENHASLSESLNSRKGCDLHWLEAKENHSEVPLCAFA